MANAFRVRTADRIRLEGGVMPHRNALGQVAGGVTAEQVPKTLYRIGINSLQGRMKMSPTALRIRSTLGALAGPSGACKRFYDCVGLDVDCKTVTYPSGFSQEECSVNGGEYAYTGSGICSSPTTTAGRFGVPWSKAQTEWNNAKTGQPCGYDPSYTIREGSGQEGRAPGSALVRTRGSAEQPNQPLSGRLLFNTYSSVCGIPWAANYEELTASQVQCAKNVLADFRRRGYNFESLQCRGSGVENMLSCSPIFIPITERTGDYRQSGSYWWQQSQPSVNTEGSNVSNTTQGQVIDVPFETGDPQQQYQSGSGGGSSSGSGSGSGSGGGSTTYQYSGVSPDQTSAGGSRYAEYLPDALKNEAGEPNWLLLAAIAGGIYFMAQKR